MLVINGALTIDPSRRDDFIAAVIAMRKASLAEEGCHHYVFTADLERDDVFHVAEKWDDQAALDQHFAMPHMADFRAATKGAVVGGSVTKYEIASESAMR